MNRSILVIAACLFAGVSGAAPIEFEDTSDKLGFERGTESWGIAWGNLNRDKYPDLWNSGHRDFTRLYRNTGTGDFEDVAAEYDAQMNDWWMILTQRDVHGGAWGDYDKDGDDDLIVGDEDEFFINHAESGGYFEQTFTATRQAFAAWIPTGDGSSLRSETDCSGNYVQLIDLDVDGDLDKVCADADLFPESRSDPEADLIPSIGNVSDTIVGDFNNDLRQDIIAIRGALRSIGASKVDDRSIDAWFREGSGARFTFVAGGKVTFLIDGLGGGAYLEADVLELDTAGPTSGEARGIEVSYNAGSGEWTVLDNSNEDQKDQHHVRVRAESFVSEPVMTGQDSRDLPAPIMHAVNRPGGFDWVYDTGLTSPVQCNSITTADFDNDMDLDLYLACGIGVENTANLYFDNNGDGTFTRITGHGGEGPIGAGYDYGVAESVVAGDYDVDGFMDLAVVNGILFYPFGFGGPDTLIRNKGNNNHWIELDLIGVTSNGNGMGAKVYVTAGGVTQLREQNGGYHRWSQDHQRIHVGLAGNTSVDEIRIEWPSGAVDTYTNVPADRLYDAVEETSLTAANLGPAVQTAINAGDECGIPEYRITYGPMIQLWRDCGTDMWHLRMESGLGRMTEFEWLYATGALVGDADFTDVWTNFMGVPDVVRHTDEVVQFRVAVQDDVTPTKTINFQTAGQQRACVWFGDTDFEAVIIGGSGKRLEPPFDILNGFGPCDSDGDGIPDPDDGDDDNDGVNDVNDAFPIDPTESRDSDGDGVGDNADLYPNDANEWKDTDADGIGDNSDVDKDNDGLTDETETPSVDPIEQNSPTFNIPGDGGDATHLFDLTPMGVAIGDTVTLTGIVADGDLDNSNERIRLEFNSGEYDTGYIQTNGRCVERLIPVDADIEAPLTVIDIGSGVPGLSIYAETTRRVDDLCDIAGVDYQLTVSKPPLTMIDQDSDGVENFLDLDSDNDGIADVVEAGLSDSDDNFIVDNLAAQQGTVTNPPDRDADGIPDYLDIESRNSRNNGTDFDIDRVGLESLDTSRDGFLSALDVGGGIDEDEDGIDSLIDIDDTVRGSNFVNTLPFAQAANVTTTLNVPVDITLIATDIDQQQLAYAVIAEPANGVLSGTGRNLTYTPVNGFKGRDNFSFTANDGYGDSQAASISIKVNDPDTPLTNWVGHTGGVTTVDDTVSYSGAPTGWQNNTVRSVAFSTLRYEDDYELRLTLESDPAGTTWVMGLGVDETSDEWTDVDFALRSSAGRLTIYENGTWRTNGATLQQGDRLSIFVNAGEIEYRHNGSTVFESSYTGSPDFYVDTSFKEGPIVVSALLAGIIDPVVVSEPKPPVTNTPSKGGGGGGSSGLLTLVGLAGLVLRGRRRSFQIGKSPLLHNFAHS